MEIKEENNQIKAPIDFIAIGKELWKYRKQYYFVLPTTLIVTYLLMLCIPRYYSCEVRLAPEVSGMNANGSIGSLASSFGLGSLAKLGGNNDAIFSEIYPNLFQSNDFIVKLMPVNITNKDGNIKCNYYTYMRDKQKIAWWGVIKDKIIELWKTSTPDTYNGKEEISVFNLTKEQSDIFEAVKGNIKCTVDKKTDIITISVKDQDPLVCATIANETCEKLQKFIVDYRTRKAKIDYEYYKKLCDEAKEKYERARQLYGSYSDANMDVVLESYKSKTEDLENEMQLKYNIYTTMNTQMQMAQAKLQEATPAFTVIQSATIPNKPAGPKRVFMSLVMMILAFFIFSGVLLVKKK